MTIAAAAVAGVVVGADRGATGGSAPTLKVARKAAGPYEPSLHTVHAPTGKTKSLHFKVKNSTGLPLTFTLEGTGDDEVNAYYRVKWFRGAKEITEKMTAGFPLTLADGKQKQYRAQIRHRPAAGDLESCVTLLASGGSRRPRPRPASTGSPPNDTYHAGMPAEQVRLQIGNLDNAVLVTGQAYQDPKDALNEFVSNAADEYALAGRRGERIRVVLRRKGRYPVVAVDDVGRGMTLDTLRHVAQSLFDSDKLGDDRTLGEKAIGLLAFQQLGGRCEIVSRPEGEHRTHALRLERGRATATLEPDERRRARQVPGTTVYLSDLDPDVLRMLTPRKVADYFRRRRGAALARGDYTLEIVEGKRSELVTPEQPEGVRLAIPAQNTLWGRLEFALYVAPEPDAHRRVAVVGRAGTTIIEDLCELEELDAPPWSTDQVSGQVVFPALQQTSGRRAIVRDRDAFPVFLDAVHSVEPVVNRTLEQVARELDEQVADRISDTVRRVFGRVLRDLDDDRRPASGFDPDAGFGLLVSLPGARARGDGPEPPCDDDAPTPVVVPSARLEDLAPPPAPAVEEVMIQHPSARPRSRSRALPTVAPDPHPGEGRSRFDHDAGVVFYNERHPDYLLVKDDEAILLDYLATLVAKEYVVWNNPRAPGDELAEEMVRLVVRVRRHLPKRVRG